MAQSPLPHVIVETDMGGDVDDTALVAFANHLADTGEIRLLAVMHNGNNPWGAAACSAINTYYGRPWLPVGAYRTAAEAGRPEYHPLVNNADPNGPRIPLSYTGDTTRGQWPRLLAEQFPCNYRSRLEYPDAVDIYARVLANAPDNSVVIVNGGYLGNLSNLIAWFDADPQLRALFQRKVSRMTGAVGGTNTCANGTLPSGMAEHVVNNPVHQTAESTWLGFPTVDRVATTTTTDMATLPLANPMREAFRYKTQIEHLWRGTSLNWHWHIVDVLTAYSTIAWDRSRQPNGLRYFDLHVPQWMNVHDNCSATVTNGAAPISHWEFQGVGLSSEGGQTVVSTSQALAYRFFDDGLLVRPVLNWSSERDHLALTATFEDDTIAGFEQIGGSPMAGPVGGKFRAPTSSGSVSSTTLLTEGRRYGRNLSFVTRVDEVPRVDLHPIASTSAARTDLFLHVQDRFALGWGNAPLVRVVSWPGRGFNGLSGQPVCRVELWDNTPGGGYNRLTSKILRNTGPGERFVMEVSLEDNAVSCRVNGEPAFASPIPLFTQPPPDGGQIQVTLDARCPNDAFELAHVLIRPTAGTDVSPDVYVDKAGTVWFSYVTAGDLESDMVRTEGGIASHFVDMDFWPRAEWGGSGFSYRFPWDHPNPAVLDWVQMLGGMRPEGIGTGYWIYGIENFPWRIGDEIVLEYRGRREGEQVPMRFR